MIRRTAFIALSMAALVLVACTRVEQPAQAAQSETPQVSQVAEVTQVAAATQVEVANATATTRGIVVRRAEAFQSGTTWIHLMIETLGPNDEKGYLSFSLTSGFQHAPLAQVGDRVELTYKNDKGYVDVQGFGIIEPKIPEKK
jgi:hypothetical protein